MTGAGVIEVEEEYKEKAKKLITEYEKTKKIDKKL
jgi:hypothetical protein